MSNLKTEKIEQLLAKARDLPAKPGIYLMKDREDKVIYVGKAKILRNRVSSYFQLDAGLSLKTLRLVMNIDHFEVILTSNEMEALVLENNLIKQYAPKYNIKLKDDRQYPYLKINVEDSYPSISVVRSRAKDGAKYFGPDSGTSTANTIKHTLQKALLLPSCSRKFPAEIGKGRPCLNLHIRQCCGLCTGKVSQAEYRELIDDAVTFLRGDISVILDALEKNMAEYAANQQFERAARCRDRIVSLKKLYDRQQVQVSPNLNADFIGLHSDELSSCICVMSLRGGKLLDTDHFVFSADEIMDAEGFEQFVVRYYSLKESPPKQVELSLELPEERMAALSEYLTQSAGYKVTVHAPERGELRRLRDLSCENAREYAVQYRLKNERDNKLLIRLASMLHLEVLPERIEAYDVSNSGDSEIVCGMIVVEDAAFKRSQYRSFNIASAKGQDDYAAMSEAIARRFNRALAEGEDTESGKKSSGFEKLPDLILLDGGVGHVNTVSALLEGMGVLIPIYGMVKDDFHKTRTLTDGSDEINIAKEQAVFTFIYNIQEEVHRYALDRMDRKRRKSVKTSIFEQIKGIGPAKAKALLAHFKSLTAVKAASAEQLAAVKGISAADAANIIDFFKKPDASGRNDEDK